MLAFTWQEAHQRAKRFLPAGLLLLLAALAPRLRRQLPAGPHRLLDHLQVEHPGPGARQVGHADVQPPVGGGVCKHTTGSGRVSAALRRFSSTLEVSHVNPFGDLSNS